MQKVKLYWEFYKSTVLLNLASAFFFSFAIWTSGKIPQPFIVIYLRCCMYGGPLICFYYKEKSRKNEYYFYYNKGITKISLLIVTWLTYILIGSLTLNILHDAKIY